MKNLPFDLLKSFSFAAIQFIKTHFDCGEKYHLVVSHASRGLALILGRRGMKLLAATSLEVVWSFQIQLGWFS